jgi:hypothetical protein
VPGGERRAETAGAGGQEQVLDRRIDARGRREPRPAAQAGREEPGAQEPQAPEAASGGDRSPQHASDEARARVTGDHQGRDRLEVRPLPVDGAKPAGVGGPPRRRRPPCSGCPDRSSPRRARRQPGARSDGDRSRPRTRTPGGWRPVGAQDAARTSSSNTCTGSGFRRRIGRAVGMSLKGSSRAGASPVARGAWSGRSKAASPSSMPVWTRCRYTASTGSARRPPLLPGGRPG